ncbi:MAG: ankyrin repeat domain-containing protein [Thermodesulfobacteriota bacterium]
MRGQYRRCRRVSAPKGFLWEGRLHKAAHKGDIELVKNLLQRDTDPDERDSFGGTALHAAMFQKNDVKAIVYQWFAGFDHQTDIALFKNHLDPDKVDTHFPDLPIRSLSGFEMW